MNREPYRINYASVRGFGPPDSWRVGSSGSGSRIWFVYQRNPNGTQNEVVTANGRLLRFFRHERAAGVAAELNTVTGRGRFSGIGLGGAAWSPLDAYRTSRAILVIRGKVCHAEIGYGGRYEHMWSWEAAVNKIGKPDKVKSTNGAADSETDAKVSAEAACYALAGSRRRP